MHRSLCVYYDIYAQYPDTCLWVVKSIKRDKMIKASEHLSVSWGDGKTSFLHLQNLYPICATNPWRLYHITVVSVTRSWNQKLSNFSKCCPKITHSNFFLKKWANLGLFFVYFRSFQTNNTIFTTNQCEKCHVHPVSGAGIRTHDLWNVSLLP